MFELELPQRTLCWKAAIFELGLSKRTLCWNVAIFELGLSNRFVLEGCYFRAGAVKARFAFELPKCARACWRRALHHYCPTCPYAQESCSS